MTTLEPTQAEAEPRQTPDSIAPEPVRPRARQFAASLIIGAAVALGLGVTLRTTTQVSANDISRWCTVWSLLERGSYAIDDCPWQNKTQDKVKKTRVEDGKEVEHYYSSKPPLLPTLIAGVLYPVRKAVGVPLDQKVEQARSPRWVQKEKEKDDEPGKFEFVLETPDEPLIWPVYVFYLKPMVVLVNLVPMLVFLILYARLLDRYAANDWAWLASLFAAALGTQLLAFDQTLNNHTVAAYSAFFALYPLLRIWDDGARSPWLFAASGFFGAFCACNELPAALFGLLLFALLFVRFPRQTLLYFVPAAAVPCIAFLATQYAAMGTFHPAYEEFGTKAYNYEGSYWNTPLEFDHLNLQPESRAVYLFHMTLGHHGILSLTPIVLFALFGAIVVLVRRPRRMVPVAVLTWVLTVAMLAFYDWNPKARNYGGSTQGLRWLFWLFPFWLITLPPGLEPGQDRTWFRRLSLAALLVSIFTVGYALQRPWSHPWMLDLMEHLDLYRLKR